VVGGGGQGLPHRLQQIPRDGRQTGKISKGELQKEEKRRTILFKKESQEERGVLIMENDTPWKRDLPQVEGSMALMETMIQEIAKKSIESSGVAKPGRPPQVSWQFLSTAILWCLLRGWISQLDLWRQISVFGLPGFAAVPVTDQAVYDRLERSAEPMQRLCAWVSQWLFDWLAPYEDRSLAPWAREILALDESTLDAMKRWIAELRGIPAGSAALLAGRLCGLFDVRRQQWKRLDWLPDPLAHCQRKAREMLDQVGRGSLLLFDLGYFNFEWFDESPQTGRVLGEPCEEQMQLDR
jgi:hypothetical protein